MENLESNLNEMEDLESFKQELLNKTVAGGMMGGYLEEGFPIYFVNNRMLEYLGYADEQEFATDNKGLIENCMHPEDRDMVNLEVDKQMKIDNSYEIQYRMRKKDNSYIWVHDIGKLVQAENGKNAIVSVCYDITTEKNLNDEMSKTLTQMENIVNSITGGVAIYKVSDRFETLYFSEGIPALSGYTVEEYGELSKGDAAEMIFEDDKNKVIEEVTKCISENSDIDITFRKVHRQTGIIWVHLQGKQIDVEGGCPILHAVFHNISKEMELYQEILDESATAIFVCEKDSKKLLYLNKAAKNLADERDVMLEGGYCYSRMMKREAVCEFCKVPQMEHDQMYTMELEFPDSDRVFNKKSRLINWRGKEAFIEYLIDVTEEKRVKDKLREEQEQVQKNYDEALALQRLTAQKSVASCLMNLTKNELVECYYDLPVFSEMENLNCEDFFEAAANHIVDEEIKEKYIRNYNVQHLLTSFENGGSGETLDVKYDLGNLRLAWLTMHITLMRHPHTGDVMAFTYAVDITMEKVYSELLGYAGRTVFDLMIYINATTERMIPCTNITEGHDEEWQYDQCIFENLELAAGRYENLDCEAMFEKLKLSRIVAELEDKEEYTFTTGAKLKDGQTSYKKHIFRYIDKGKTAIAFIRTDITDLYIQERIKNEELSSALVLANQANEAKNNFLSAMSHDIRTPMNAIIGMTEVARNYIDDAAQLEKSLDIIDNASKHLLTIINDILDMSKLENGKMVFVKEEFNFTQELKRIEEIYINLAKQKNRIFKVELKNLEHKACIGDIQRIQRVLENLLGNAIKFTPEGGEITLIVKEKPYKKPNYALYQMIVRDNGVGISEDEIPHVFEPFYRSANVEKNNIEGTGLGLSIVKNIVNSIGGTIDVVSKEGDGTAFIVNLLMEIGKSEVRTPAQKKDTQEIDLTGVHILLVEDHPINIMVARLLLESYGAEVDIAENGQSGYDKFVEQRKNPYDLIFMDIQMPVMNGYEATRAIRESGYEGAADIPIIAMTANAFVEDVQKSLNNGMNGHVAKPINIKAIGDVLRQVGVIK